MPLEDGTSVAARLGEIGRLTEELDFSGLWITDSIGRAMASLDPLALLGAVAPVTSRIELGTCVLQIPLRHPVELAHRVMSLDVLSEGRLRLGIGAGSTEGDFQAVQADYQGRFKALTENLAVMRRTWQGEAIYGPGVIPWPGHEQGPPLFLGAWASPRWIEYAATECQGWMGSGIYSTIDGVAEGVSKFRAADGNSGAAGGRIILANVFTDLRPDAVPHPLVAKAKINLVCDPGQLEQIRKLVPGA